MIKNTCSNMLKITIKSLFIFLLSCQLCSAQDLFSDLNSTIKEALSFHMLINQNDVDQLEEFVEDYNYFLDSDDEFVYLKKFSSDNDSFDVFIRTHLISSDDIKTRTKIFFIQDNNIELDEDFAINLFNTFLKVIYYSRLKIDNYESNIMGLSFFEKVKSLSIENNATITNKTKHSFVVEEHNTQYICGNITTVGDFISYSGPIRDIIQINPIINDTQTNFVIQLTSYFSEDSLNDNSKFNYHEFLSAKYLNEIIWDKFKSN